MIISRTPFRISLFGGGTDYPTWFREHGGAVIGTAIDKYCYISVRRLPPFFEHKSKIVYSKVELVKDTAEIEHPAVRGILTDLGVTDGLEIHHDADLPARSGLGSSSSFTVGLLNALYALNSRMISKRDLGRASDPHRAGGAQGRRRLPGPDLGGLWRLQSHRLSPRRHLLGDAVHPAAGAAHGACAIADAVLHRLLALRHRFRPGPDQEYEQPQEPAAHDPKPGRQRRRHPARSEDAACASSAS